MAVRIAVHLHPVLLFEPCLVADVDAHETIPANGVAAAVIGMALYSGAMDPWVVAEEFSD